MVLLARTFFFCLLAFALTARGLDAQVQAESNLRRPVTSMQQISGPQSTLEDELHQMSERAAVIFAGQVLSVKQPADMGSGWVDVQFRVDAAIRGCIPGTTYQLREWAGLWTGGRERYRAGERLLMMLHAPGASGLSSPVDGQDGAIPITGSGPAPKPGDGFTGSGDQAVDLRWVQARVLRTQPDGGRGHGSPISPVEPMYVGRELEPFITRKTMVQPASNLVEVQTEVNPPGSQTMTLRGVLALLGAWEAQQSNAAR